MKTGRALIIVVATHGLFACGDFSCDKKAATASSPLTTRPTEGASTGPARAVDTLAPPVPTTPLTDKDLESCAISEGAMKQATCVAALAQRTRDPRYCEAVNKIGAKATDQDPDLLRNGSAANACYKTIALMRDDAQLCARISDPSMSASCLTFFAMKRRDTKVCDLGRDNAVAMCYLNEAARTRDVALCTKTGQYQKDCEKRLGPAGP
jgi:hypothetical protein